MRPKKKPLTAVQKLNVMCCGQEGCDWGLTCILVSIVLLGGAMALVAAFGEFSNWNMMGSVSSAWQADGDDDVFTNGYSDHPGSAGPAQPSAAVFGATDHKGDTQKAPPGATFASSTADSVRDFLGLGKDGPPSWARHSAEQISGRSALAAKRARMASKTRVSGWQIVEKQKSGPKAQEKAS